MGAESLTCSGCGQAVTVLTKELCVSCLPFAKHGQRCYCGGLMRLRATKDHRFYNYCLKCKRKDFVLKH